MSLFFYITCILIEFEVCFNGCDIEPAIIQSKEKRKKLTTTTTKSGGRGVNKHQEKEQKFTASNKYLCCNGF